MGKCHDEPGPWSNCILLILVLSCFLLSLSVLALCGARERAATARYCFVHCCLGLGLALARIMSCLTLALGFVLVCVLSCLVCLRLGLGPVFSWFFL